MPEQAPILTVTLNPALDLSARVDEMVAGPKLRLTNPVLEPGGGGVNVARAIKELGGTVRAWVAHGGATGAQHLGLMRDAGLVVQSFAAPGETRQSWAITDQAGAQYRLQLPGADWPKDQEIRARADIIACAEHLVILSGSQPPGVSAGFPQALAHALGQGRLIVDTSGAALDLLLEQPDPTARPLMLRLDQSEASARASDRAGTVADSLEFAQQLVARGVADIVCLALGAGGSVLASRDARLHCQPPNVRVASKVGAGDSFTGAFAHALARDQDLGEALTLGTAAAAAAVMTEGTALFSAAEVARCLPECHLTQHVA